MKSILDKLERRILNILIHWRDEEQTVYELDYLQNIDHFQEPQPLDCCLFSYDVPDDIAQQFFEIGGTGEGSYYALWFYPELNGKSPPVVFLGGDGHYCMVAPSIEAWAGLLAIGKFIFPEVENYTTSVWQDWRRWHPDLSEIAEDFDLDDDESAELALQEDIDRFRLNIEKEIELKSFSEYMEEMQQHKDFRSWYKFAEEHEIDTNQYVDTKGNYYDPFLRVPIITASNNFEILTEAINCPIDCKQLEASFADLGLRVPETKGENQLSISANKELGLDFSFGDRFKSNTELTLNKISVYDNCVLDFPFDIDHIDPYETIVFKIGIEAQYTHKRSKNMRMWIFEKDDGSFFKMTISFREKQLLSWSGFVLSVHKPNEMDNYVKL